MTMNDLIYVFFLCTHNSASLGLFPSAPARVHSNIDIDIDIDICLSASALYKTVHTLRKSYHVGRCVFGTLAAVRRTTLRSRPCVRYGRRRQFS